MLGEKLLGLQYADYDVSEHERMLELLKVRSTMEGGERVHLRCRHTSFFLQVRFGDSLVTNLDVMLRDIVDSKRIAKAVSDEVEFSTLLLLQRHIPRHV